MSSYISVEGSLYAQDTEDGYTSNNIPFEIYSDYSSDPTNTYFRQLQFSNVASGSTYMGVSNVGSYFYISEPSASAMSEQSNTFIITLDGNVGIGITNPTHGLHVEGKLLARGSIGGFTSATVSDNIHTSNVVIGDGKLVVGGNPNHRIPTGTIALWESKSNIPSGWSLFDAIGTSFVRGSTTTGSTSGANTVTFNNTHFPKHNHTTNTSSKYTDTGHNHSSPYSIDNTNAIHSHNISYNVVNSTYTNHNHFVKDHGNNSVNNLYETNFGGNVKRFYNSNTNFTRNLSTYDHRHNIGPPNNSAIAQNAAAHTHNVNTTVNNTSRWYHAAYNTSNTNGVTNNNNYNIIPKYASYVFIIKQ